MPNENIPDEDFIINKTLLSIYDNLNNINSSFDQFKKNYKKDNLSGLFKASEIFYDNSNQFITSSLFIFKNHFQSLSQTSGIQIILENMSELKKDIIILREDRNNWLSSTTLPDDPNFEAAIQSGDVKFEILENKIIDFNNTVLNKARNGF
jgi:hypothetical protein